ncbi:MAG: nicotinate-nucleotide pyrophosphorylase (carboxylating), partial [Nonlabens sp.]
MRIFEKKTDIMDYNSIEAQEEITRIIQNALREDLGDGDHSSLSCIPTTATGKARLLVKDDGILAGVAFAQAVFKEVDPNLHIDVRIEDG